MAARLEKTRYPGIYRRGSVYTFSYRDHLGKQRWATARTLRDARTDKERLQRTKGGLRGSDERLAAYLEAWVERYQGRGRRGFREETRAEYRRDLARYAIRHFGRHATLGDVRPRDVSEFVAWLTRQPNGRGGRLADATIRRVVAPLQAAMATAVAEGLIEHDPTRDVTLPHRPRIVDDEADHARPLSREQLAAFLGSVNPRHRLMFRFAAATGLRASEIIGLDVRHLRLSGEAPHVRVRQRFRSGRLDAPKSKAGTRDVPLAQSLVDELRAHVRGRGQGAICFPSRARTRLDVNNVRNQVITPAAEEAGAPWAGWHTFRHTCASLLFAQGRNVVQVQRWLGHSSPDVTWKTYLHLLPGELGDALDLDFMLGKEEEDPSLLPSSGTVRRPAHTQSAVAS